MSLFTEVCLGIGLAVACGVGIILPALLAAALGSGAHAVLGVSFAHGGLRFLGSTAFLIALAVAVAIIWVARLRLGAERLERGPAGTGAELALGAALGALLFAGTLADHHRTLWPGLIAGAACAGLGYLAVRPLLAGARRRLADRAAREALLLYAEALGLVIVVLTALVKPLSLAALAGLAYLLAVSRRRSGRKYAGLRILR